MKGKTEGNEQGWWREILQTVAGLEEITHQSSHLNSSTLPGVGAATESELWRWLVPKIPVFVIVK